VPGRGPRQRTLGSPFLTDLRLDEAAAQPGTFPFTLPCVADGLALQFTTPVTFFVGENGSGKSTLLEAIAWKTGFAARGGTRQHRSADDGDGHALGRALRLGWRQRVTDGFYLRAETFHEFAQFLEQMGSSFRGYGDAPLRERSHGEAFLAVMQERFTDGLVLLDEPEAALSPQRQLALLTLLHQLAAGRGVQFLIATHSPILLALPGATLLSFDDGTPQPVRYEDTAHYQVTREFLLDPARMLRHLVE
jgi:predicted ATPase